jgi:Arf-GAP/SH3 domain/ANK repeat/PH domain-containing protein
MQNLDRIILFPVDNLLKTEMRGSKGDSKRPFDRSWKDYQEKYNEIERQKKKVAKEAGKEINWCTNNHKESSRIKKLKK